MAQGVVNFKVFLHENNKNVDCRRVGIDADVGSNVDYLKGKLETIFPTLRNNSYTITWIDSDQDTIRIVNDEDLITAITDMSENVKVLHVHVEAGEFPTDGRDKEEQAQNLQSNVYCDSCSKPITDYRYKCLQCPDFDLCANCEQMGNHSEHLMLRASKPVLPDCISRGMLMLSRSLHKYQLQSFKEAARTSRHRRFGSFSGREDRGRHHGKEKKGECPFGDIPMYLNFENLSNVILSTLDHFTNPQAGNANTGNPENTPSSAQQNQPQQQTPATGGEAATNVPKPTAPPSAPSQDPKVMANQPTASTQQSSGVSTPNGSFYPVLPMETEPTGWTILQPQQSSTEAVPVPVEQPKEQPKSKIAEGLQKLIEIGFKDEEMLVTLLKKYDGNVAMVIRHILDTMN